MQQIIHENEINHELTQKIRKDPKYDVFKNWLKANGALWKDIDFPVAFGPAGVVGIAAARDIEACSGIAAIPNQLLITTTKVREGELAKFIEENPELFKHDSDADFNILSIFLFREKIKGKESFYFPMIDVLDKSTILLHWKRDEIKELDDPYILKEAHELELEMDKTWDEFSKVFEKYQDLFPPSKANREDFFWCYEAVMTRCFGWSLPATMIIPLADFLNHNADGTTHYMVNKEFEKDEDEAHEAYVMKKRKIDLSVFDDDDMLLEEEDKKKYHAPGSEIVDYIKKNIDYLSEESKKKLDGGDYDKQDQRRMLREVNFNILVKEKDRQVWELSWFESSDEEDNDTEEEEGEVPESGQGVFEATNKEELEKIKNDQKVQGKKSLRFQNKNEVQAVKTFQDEEVKENKTPTKPKSAVVKDKEEKGDEGDNEDGEDNEEEEEENDDDNEQVRTEKDKYKYGKGVITEKFSPNKYFRHHVSTYEKKEVDKIKKFSSPKKDEVEEQQQENENDEEEEDEDDSDWTWFEDSDKNSYFVVSTHSHLSYKKGEQIFHCYGRRSNRFLLMWYGFCVQDNRYNSMSFRLWMNKSSLSDSNPPKRILFQDYITGQEWEDRAINGEKNANPEELTKEFRIKTSRLSEDILAFLRAKLILAYKGLDLNKILVTIPASIPYEEFVIDYAISLFSEILNQYKTTVVQDEEILKEPNLDWKKRFAVVYRLEQKKIAHLQLRLLKILVHTLQRVKMGNSLKDSYMEYLPEVEESEEDFVENRRRIANYLKLFYEAPR